MAAWNPEQIMSHLHGSPLAQRWRQLARRERLMLGVLALFVLAVVLYLAVWRPAAQYRANALTYFQQQRDLYAYLQAHAPAAQALQTQPKALLDPERLQGQVTMSAAQHGLSVERLEAGAEGGLQVSLQPTEAARLLSWLAEMHEQGVRIDEAGLDRQVDSRVSVRLTLRVSP
jgi:general secretion pathway protein M